MYSLHSCTVRRPQGFLGHLPQPTNSRISQRIGTTNRLTFEFRIGPKILQLTLTSALAMIPIKPLQVAPHALHDGGGKGSQPDWSAPPNTEDVLKPLRDSWINLILEQGLHKAFLAHVEQAQSTPPFSDECIDQFRTSLSAWLPMDWSIRDDQPMHLAAMQALSHRLHDPDSEVFTSLIAGVSAGAADTPFYPVECFGRKIR